jgi:hypothetical protein
MDIVTVPEVLCYEIVSGQGTGLVGQGFSALSSGNGTEDSICTGRVG